MRWWNAKFSIAPSAAPAGAYLEASGRPESLLKNESPGGPLRLGGQVYQHGLYTDGLPSVRVHLPVAATAFDATVALRLDWLGRGNCTTHALFSLLADGRKAGSVGPIPGGSSGTPFHVALNGAKLLELAAAQPPGDPPIVTALWADARVTLVDGRVLWLDQLPVAPLASPASHVLPFSFQYGGRPARDLLSSWMVERTSRRLDDGRAEHVIRYRDPETGLEVRVVAVRYLDFPTLEWTVYFRNTGRTKTPLIDDVQAIDTFVQRNGDGEFTLYAAKGSETTPTDYEPLAYVLGPDEGRDFVSEGRPTSKNLGCFAVAWPGAGIIVGLGWPGQWHASFARDHARSLRIMAGQGRTHFRLDPGEEARSPLVVMQFWEGSRIQAQNEWRRWMLAHNSPKPAGSPLGNALWSCYDPPDFAQTTEQKNIQELQLLLQAGITPDFWELDAGWYVNDGTWTNTGTWIPDPQRFPGGLKPLLDFAHAHGIRNQVWFEPERVTRGSWLWKTHPEWLLRCSEWEHAATTGDPDHRAFGDDRLLDLGNPEARQWLVAMADRYIGEGVDFYRTDFNIDPLPFWRAADAPDRQGLTENHYVTGFLTYLDALLRRHPHLLLDTCASGGRRDDLETLRRAIPVTRSDYFADPTGAQNQTYGIAFWMPRYGTGTVGFDPYTNRSAWGPWPGIAWDLSRPGHDLSKLRSMAEECRSLASYYYGDYYPLTPYDPGNAVWMAWQFDRPELDSGMVQVFRRSESPYASAVFRLHGINPAAEYEIRNLDETRSILMPGRELMEHGLVVSLPVCPAAAIFVYRTRNPAPSRR